MTVNYAGMPLDSQWLPIETEGFDAVYFSRPYAADHHTFGSNKTLRYALPCLAFLQSGMCTTLQESQLQKLVWQNEEALKGAQREVTGEETKGYC